MSAQAQGLAEALPQARRRRALAWLAAHRGIVAITAAFILLCSVYSMVNPLYEAPDETFHLAVVEHIARTGTLPRVEPGVETPSAQEATQPPLYYALGAAASWWAWPDEPAAPRLNPHAAIGQPGAPDNKNRSLHGGEEAFPWRGEVAAAHLVRFMSVLMGAATVALTYALVREIWPGSEPAALLAAGLVGFNPQFLFISGAANNDTLMALVGAWLMLLAVRVIRHGLTERRTAALAVVTVLVLLTKLSGLSFLPLVAAVLVWQGWRRRDWRGAARSAAAIALACLVFAGWWYARNLRLYGDPTALAAHLSVMPRRDVALLDLRHEWQGLWQSYWAMFGWFNVPAPRGVYTFYAALSLLAAAGLAAWAVVEACRRHWAALGLPALLAAQVVLTFASLVRWSLLTYGSQGRLLFPVIASIAVLMAGGLTRLLALRWQRAVVVAVGVPLLVLAAALPWLVIRPAYTPPSYAGGAARQAVDFTALGGEAPALRLLGASVSSGTALPGDTVVVTADWEVISMPGRDWSVYVHLADSAELLAGQYDSYPGGGLLATSDLVPGTRWTDTYHVPVSETAYSPETLEVRLGLYDYATGERMALATGDDAGVLGEVALHEQPGADVPNPVSIDFGGEMRLAGYEISPRTARPGESVSVVLYWQGQQPVTRDFTVSVQVLGQQDQHNVGQEDSQPAGGALPTSGWEPGVLVGDASTVEIAADAPPGVYDVQIVVYWFDEAGQIQRLERLGEHGEPLDAALLLTSLRVEP